MDWLASLCGSKRLTLELRLPTFFKIIYKGRGGKNLASQTTAYLFRGRPTSISEESGIPVMTISDRKNRILKKLKKYMENKNNSVHPPSLFRLISEGVIF